MATDKFTAQRSDKADTLGISALAYTPADSDLPISTKAVVFDADGTISYKNAGDVSATTGFPVAKGVPLPFVPARVTAMTGPTKCFLIS